MAVDNNGDTVNAGDLCLLSGVVREIDGDTLVIITADGKHRMRVKSTDTRRVAGLGSGVSSDHGSLAGLGDDDHTQYMPTNASRSFSAAPSSSVAAAVASTQLVRQVEVEAIVASLIGSVAAALAAKQDLDATLTAIAGLTASAGLVEQTGSDAFTKRAIGVGASTSIPTRADGDTRYAAAAHGHDAADIPLDDSSWSGALSGSGVRDVQGLADWIDANFTP